MFKSKQTFYCISTPIFQHKTQPKKWTEKYRISCSKITWMAILEIVSRELWNVVQFHQDWSTNYLFLFWANPLKNLFFLEIE